MPSDLAQVLKDAAEFQAGLNAFEDTDFSKKCPPTQLIFKEITNPDLQGAGGDTPPNIEDRAYVTVTVKDYITDEPLPAVLVKVDSRYAPQVTTNSEGIASPGYLEKRTQFDVTLRKTLYVKSVDDTLTNDSITTQDMYTPPCLGCATPVL